MMVIIIFAGLLIINGAGLVGSMPGVGLGGVLGVGPGVPENITITFLTPTSVKVSWATSIDNVDKYDVTYKPTDASYRVVAVVAGNSEAVTLSGLKADTQYQVSVAAVWAGRKYRSRPIVFRTLEPPRSSSQQEGGSSTVNPAAASVAAAAGQQIEEDRGPPPINPDEFPNASTTVRGVEIGIVLLVLAVWVAAIALFFNRWGKIRMLLPYQPDYKSEQLKVPGTAACAAAVAAGNSCTHHNGSGVADRLCSQKFGWSSENGNEDWQAYPSRRRQRPRINSAIFVSNSGPGFEAAEFFRRHGSRSTLCRKAHSVDNISSEDEEKKQLTRLPQLSVSGPSPPTDNDSEDENDACL